MQTVKVLGNYIGGKFRRSGTPDEKIVSKDPGDFGYSIGSFPVYTSHAQDACLAAQKACGEWFRAGISGRSNMLRKFSAQVVNHREELASVLAAETGRPYGQVRQEVLSAESRVEVEVRESIRFVSPFDVGEIEYGIRGSCSYKPLGVAVVLGSAVHPLEQAMNQILPALLAGNTVIYKPSKLTPASGQFVATLFDASDLPKGVFNMVQGDAAYGLKLACHPSVDAVLFTGSYLSGKKLWQAIGQTPSKQVVLQMGGVNTALILEDADLTRALAQTLEGAFLSSGQNHMTTSVILVHVKLFGRFLQRLVPLVKSLSVGYAFEKNVFMGPMLSEKARDRFLDVQKKLEKKTTRAWLTSQKLKKKRPGYYLGPAIWEAERTKNLDDLRPNGLVFGPDVVLVPIKNVAEGIHVANTTSFPFVASVFTEDRKHFLNCLENLRYGVIHHNLPTTYSSMRLPFGGLGHCGNHRTGGLFAQRNLATPIASLQSTTPFDMNRLSESFPRKKLADPDETSP